MRIRHSPNDSMGRKTFRAFEEKSKKEAVAMAALNGLLQAPFLIGIVKQGL